MQGLKKKKEQTLYLVYISHHMPCNSTYHVSLALKFLLVFMKFYIPFDQNRN